MRLIDATSAEAYLRETGRVSPGERITVRELAGGVSNIVLLVEFPGGERPSFVLKQAREQLRVAQPWFCSPERIWREVEVLKACDTLLRSDSVQGIKIATPIVLWEDRQQFAFAMTAAPPEARTWKSTLMAGEQDLQVPAACGRLLGQLHGGSWQNDSFATTLADRRFFEDLRVAPYYLTIAVAHPHIASKIETTIADMRSYPRALVHGDFSPKNLLVTSDTLTLIDCEVGHYGDPTFDVGFFLTHLQLKAIHSPARAEYYRQCSLSFLTQYAKSMPSEAFEDLSYWPRTFSHFRGCMLARVDGKSPVEYLRPHERDAVRQLALGWFQRSRITTEEALANVSATAQKLASTHPL